MNDTFLLGGSRPLISIDGPLKESSRILLVSLFISAVVFSVYLPVIGYPFLRYDDPFYVTGNDMVKAGITSKGLQYAFTSLNGFWQPGTWIFLMLEAALFGTNPQGFHSVNLLLHLANTLLLFTIARYLSNKFWSSALLAVLFSCHPLNVESVVWISEVKGLLASLLGLASTLAYVRFVKTRSLQTYGLVIAYYSFGLMCKPSIVVLPGIFLILDYFALKAGGVRPATAQQMTFPTKRSSWWGRVGEKLPLLLVGVVLTIVDYFAEKRFGAVRGLAEIPISARLANAIHSMTAYLLKAFFPVRLSIFYPYDTNIPNTVIVLSGACLISLVVVAFLLRKRFCWLAIGLVGFGIMLIPSLGLIQIGEHAMADRYMYLPLAFLLAIPCAMLSRAASHCSQRVVLVLCSVVLCGSFAISARGYVAQWSSDRAIFTNALTVCPRGNFVAHNELGLCDLNAGRIEAAIAHLTNAECIAPRSTIGHHNLALVYQMAGRMKEAEAEYKITIALDPNSPDSLANYAFFLLNTSEGRPDRRVMSVHLATRALALAPLNPRFYNLLATVLHDSGRTNAASDIWRLGVTLIRDKP